MNLALRPLFLLASCTALLAARAPSAALQGGSLRGPGSISPPGEGAGSGTSSGPTTAGDDEVSDDDPSGWRLWWSYNRDPYLDLQAAVHADAGGRTGSGGFFGGLGQAPADSPPLQPPLVAIRESAVPALLAVLAEDEQPSLLAAALIALGKIGPEGAPPGGPPLATHIEPFLAHASREVAESAVLALGILGEPGVAPTLAALLGDQTRGRELVEAKRVPTRVRAFAGYGLGLLAARSPMLDLRRYATMQLFAAFASDPGGTHDIEVACLIAAGLAPLELPAAESPGADAPAHASRRGQVEALLAIFADERRADLERAHAAVPAARLARSSPELRARCIEVLLPVLHPHGKAPQLVTQAAVTAAGLLGDDDDDEIDVRLREALVRFVAEGDRLGRRLAWIALAEIAANPGAGVRSGKGRSDVRAVLLRELADGSTLARPWAALALGVMEARLAAAGETTSADVAAALRAALAGAGSPDEAAACALALGLARDISARSVLEAQAAGGGAATARAFACLALGLLGEAGSNAVLREVLADSLLRPALMREAAIGLALLGDKETVALLVAELRRSDSQTRSAAIATALTRMGDVRALRPLVELLGDREAVSATTRAFAAAALGGVCDKEPLPFNSKLATDVLYAVPPATLTDPVDGGGVLDLL